jgi:uncharacterized protein YegJ (DUF2314 family)
MQYTLDDGEALNQEFPDTFEIPTRENRESQQVGDLVKLIFRITINDEEFVERMWVIITHKNGHEFTGKLDNQPFCTLDLKAGDAVTFSSKHIINIDNVYY